MNLRTAPYSDQIHLWPQSGRHILAQYDESSIIVYQAYSPEIGHYAAQNNRFGPGFSLARMTWIKPNFLWMMYRSGWATKPAQEVVLAIRLQREAFDYIINNAVPSSFDPNTFSTESEWKSALAHSPIRLQWDPDHNPAGAPTPRRAIQLGIGGSAVHSYVNDWILDIQNITPFVHEQSQNARSRPFTNLITPAEAVYPSYKCS